MRGKRFDDKVIGPEVQIPQSLYQFFLLRQPLCDELNAPIPLRSNAFATPYQILNAWMRQYLMKLWGSKLSRTRWKYTLVE